MNDRTKITIRDLRNHGGEVVDRVLAGESLTVTRAGSPVAVLRPISQRSLDAATLLTRWRHLPRMGADALSKDIDGLLDPSL